jgi:hypothetical protein
VSLRQIAEQAVLQRHALVLGLSRPADRGAGDAVFSGRAGSPRCASPDASTWVTLLTRSADEVGLPNDAEFRAAFTAYLEWGSRIAVENSQSGSFAFDLWSYEDVSTHAQAILARLPTSRHTKRRLARYRTGEQRVLVRIPNRGRRRQDQPRAPGLVCSVLAILSPVSWRPAINTVLGARRGGPYQPPQTPLRDGSQPAERRRWPADLN